MLPRAERGRRNRRWLRSAHRWVGVGVALFLLMLAVTGVALNHADDWHLDRRYVSWSWLLDAYGIRAPAPAASFADRGYRATQLADTLYFEGKPVQEGIGNLSGLVVTGPVAVAGLADGVLVMTLSGDVIERIGLEQQLGGPIRRIGRTGDAVVVDGPHGLLVSDPDVTGFVAPGVEFSPDALAWPAPTPPSAAELETLNRQYRGRGLTVERLLADLHSGRAAGAAGRLAMDVVAVLLIVLAVSGIVIWARNGRRDDGNGGYRPPPKLRPAGHRSMDKRRRRNAE